MIRFQLRCPADHGFEAWFRNNADFDGQSARGQVACPICGSDEIRKALMAPAVSTARKRGDDAAFPVPPPVAPNADGSGVLAAGLDPKLAKAVEFMQEMTRKVRASSDYVGTRFAEEARKIHYEEAPPRSIYGEATPGEAQELAEEGIGFHPLPTLPEDRN
ncbi:MAG: DUF1178 family protein [Bauldia sp.]